MSKAVNAYARLLLRLKTRDNSGAFRVYRVSLLKKLPLERVRARGYAFQEEILFRCREAGATFAEVPIAFEERRYGHTKINWKEAAATLWILACLPWERSARNSLPG
jgi:dolichol-phosphate mannosyltransferase